MSAASTATSGTAIGWRPRATRGSCSASKRRWSADSSLGARHSSGASCVEAEEDPATGVARPQPCDLCQCGVNPLVNQGLTVILYLTTENPTTPKRRL